MHEAIKYMPGRPEEEVYDLIHKITTVGKLMSWWTNNDDWWNTGLVSDFIYVEGFNSYEQQTSIKRFLLMVKNEVIHTSSKEDNGVWITEFKVANKTIRILSFIRPLSGPMYESIKHLQGRTLEEIIDNYNKLNINDKRSFVHKMDNVDLLIQYLKDVLEEEEYDYVYYLTYWGVFLGTCIWGNFNCLKYLIDEKNFPETKKMPLFNKYRSTFRTLNSYLIEGLDFCKNYRFYKILKYLIDTEIVKNTIDKNIYKFYENLVKEKLNTSESKINQGMKKINEEEQTPIYSEAHAKELLNLQVNYNKMLQDLNNKLAKQKSDLAIKYMKLSQQAKQVAAAKVPNPQQKNQQQSQQRQTGTVDTAGNPVNSQGNPNPPNESIDILRIKDINEALPGGMDWEKHVNMSNWYQKNKTFPRLPSPRIKRMDRKRRQRIQDLEYEIMDLKSHMESIMSPYTGPTHTGAEGDLENFWGEIGTEAAEILNSGAYTNSHEKLRALRNAGIDNPQYVLDIYHEYFPEYNPKKERQRIHAEKEAAKIQEKIDKIQARIDKWEEVYESLNESLSTYNTDNADQDELQSLKDYMNAEGIEYTEDEDTIEFDDEQLDSEWQELISSMGLEPTEISADVKYIENEDDDIEHLDVENDDVDIVETDEEIDEDKVFYVKVSKDGAEFTGKIYKLFNDGDWRAKIVDGNSDTFEQLNYDPEFDEVDIIAFLRENYDSAELIDQNEFDDHAEKPEEEPIEENMNESQYQLDKIYNYYMTVDISKLDKSKSINNVFLNSYMGKLSGNNINKGTPLYVAWKAGKNRKEKETNITEKIHLPTLDEYINEI